MRGLDEVAARAHPPSGCENPRSDHSGKVRSMSKRGLRLRLAHAAAAGVLSLASVAPASAQACVGLATRGGQGFLVGQAGFTDGAWIPGGVLGVDTEGPATVFGRFAHALFDNSDAAISAAGGGLAIEIPDLAVSLCPTANVMYQWLSNDGGLSSIDADGVVFGGGLALGHRFDSRTTEFAFIPNIAAGIEHNRSSLTVGDTSITGSETYGVFSGGFVLMLGSVFLGPSAAMTTLEGADPIFSAHLGVMF